MFITQERARIAALFLALPGVVALFLPFTGGLSPLEAARGLVEGFILPWDWDTGWFRDWSPGLLGLAFFLAIPIAAWQARRLFIERLSKFELALAYFLSTGAMLTVVTVTVHLADEIRGLTEMAIFSSCSILAMANVILLMRNLARSVTRETAAETFLLGGYFPVAAFCLLFVSWHTRIWSIRLQIGAFAVAVACIAYLITIVLSLRSKDSRRPRTPAEVRST